MKPKFHVVIALIIGLLILSSCQKERPYNPSKRIKQINHTYTYMDGNMEEQTIQDKQIWNWKGKRLDNIVYYDGQDNQTDIIVFHYDNKNRFSEIENKSGYFRFTYNDKKLEKIEHFTTDNITLTDEYLFTATDTNVVEVKHIIHSSSAKASANPLQFVFPENAVDIMARHVGEKGGSYTYTFEWKNNNLVGMTEVNIAVKGTYYYHWNYDQYENPYKGIFSQLWSDFPNISYYVNNISYNVNNSYGGLYSANNIIKSTVNHGTHDNIITYHYQYDGELPIYVEWLEDDRLSLNRHTKTFIYQ